MKLRNKKTGEIVEPYLEWCSNSDKPNSLTKLYEEYEDYEEPKETMHIVTPVNEIDNSILIEFDIHEEAVKAGEKLIALKRLKDNGFEFTGWERDAKYYGDFTITATDQTSCDDKDLDLLFGGGK